MRFESIHQSKTVDNLDFSLFLKCIYSSELCAIFFSFWKRESYMGLEQHEDE